MHSNKRRCNCQLPTCRGQGQKIPARTCRYHEKHHGYYEGRVDEHATASPRLETAAAKRQRHSTSPPSSFGPSRGASEADLDYESDVSEPELRNLPSSSDHSNHDSDNTSSWSESESEWGGASQSTPSSRSSSHSPEDSDDEDALQRHLQRHLQQQISAENNERQREWEQDTDSNESETDSDDSADKLHQLDPSVHGGFISILQCCKIAFPASPPGSSFRLRRPFRYAGDLYEKAHVSQGQAVLLIETLADECCLAKATKSKIYKLFKQLLPDPNTLPRNAYYASKLLKAFMPKRHKFPVCVGDCILLPENTKPNRDVVCPNCQQNLFKNGKARKYFRTLPLKSIVRHLFASRQIAEMLGKEWIYNVTPGWLQSFTGRDACF